MGSSDKGFVPLVSIKPSDIHKFSLSDADGNNENDINCGEVGCKFQKPRKSTAKHFMSPTISAATKAVVPRKKILADRNEAWVIADNDIQKTPCLDPKSSPKSSGVGHSGRISPSLVSPHTWASDSDNDDVEKNKAGDSLKPYDPLTNYLSPRPKFLRYKPNRRRAIFSHPENELQCRKYGSGSKTSVSFDTEKGGSEEESSANARSSVVPFSEGDSVTEDDGAVEKSEGGHVDKNNEKEDGEEEEIEEFKEEERVWSLKELFKVLLVVLAVFLFTSYTASMNSPTPSPTLKVLKDEYQKIKRYMIEPVSTEFYGIGSKAIDRTGEMQIDEAEVNWIPNGNFYEEEEMVERANEVDEVVTIQDELEFERKFDHTKWDQFPVSETVGSEDSVCNQEMGSMGESNDILLDSAMEKMVKVSDQFQGIETLEKYESFQDNNVALVCDEVDHQDTTFDIPVASEIDMSVGLNFKDGEAENGVDINPIGGTSNKESGKEEVENEMETTEEDSTADVIDDIVSSEGIDNGDIELDSAEALNSPDKFGSVPMVVITCLSLILASLPLVYWTRQNKASVEESPRVEKLLAESAKAEARREACNVEEEEITAEGIRPLLDIVTTSKGAFFESPSNLIHSEEASKEFSNSHVPRVELLGELVIGEPSSSLRSCSMKSKMLETEESNNSVSQGKGSQIKAPRAVTSQAEGIRPLLDIVTTSQGAFFESPSNLIHSEEASKGFSNSHVPRVELLGELVIGEPSSSLRSCSMKSKMLETEESNNSISQGKGSQIQAPRAVTSQAQPSLMELSTADSPSRGSLRPQKKLVKKEESPDGMATPVRRSSRIRNRSVMSP